MELKIFKYVYKKAPESRRGFKLKPLKHFTFNFYFTIASEPFG